MVYDMMNNEFPYSYDGSKQVLKLSLFHTLLHTHKHMQTLSLLSPHTHTYSLSFSFSVFPFSLQQPPRFGLPKIKAIIELSQVGLQTDRDTTSPVYYLHHNNQPVSIYNNNIIPCN